MAHQTGMKPLDPSSEDVLGTWLTPIKWIVTAVEAVVHGLLAFGAYLSVGFGFVALIVVLAMIDSIIPEPISEVEQS